MKDAKTALQNVDRSLEVSGDKAEKVFGFKFIPARDAVIASAKSIKKFTA